MTRHAQDPNARPRGVIFFARRFAVDPGEGAHISHKINHSAELPNLRAVARRSDDDGGERVIFFLAARVRSFAPLHKHARDNSSLSHPPSPVTWIVPLSLSHTLSHPTLLQDIAAGEQLLYDYGDRRPASVAAFPWLGKSCIMGANPS